MNHSYLYDSLFLIATFFLNCHSRSVSFFFLWAFFFFFIYCNPFFLQYWSGPGESNSAIFSLEGCCTPPVLVDPRTFPRILWTCFILNVKLYISFLFFCLSFWPQKHAWENNRIFIFSDVSLRQIDDCICLWFHDCIYNDTVSCGAKDLFSRVSTQPLTT